MNEKKIFSSSIAILFNYLLFSYIQRLEKIGCDCGLKRHSDIVKTSIIINYIIIFGKLFTKSVPPVTLVLIALSDIAFTIYTLIFLYRLKNEKCKCSDSMVRDVYYYYYLLIIILIALLVSLLVVYIVF